MSAHLPSTPKTEYRRCASQNYKNKIRKENINEENYKIPQFRNRSLTHLHSFICVIRIERQVVGMKFLDEDSGCVQILRFDLDDT